jgi:hypothetical protein
LFHSSFNQSSLHTYFKNYLLPLNTIRGFNFNPLKEQAKNTVQDWELFVVAIGTCFTPLNSTVVAEGLSKGKPVSSMLITKSSLTKILKQEKLTVMECHQRPYMGYKI